MEAITRAHISLLSELDVLDAAGGCREDVFWDSVERVSTGYSRLVRNHASSYRNRLDVSFTDAQSGDEYATGYLIRVSRERYSLTIYQVTSDKGRRDCLSSPERVNGDTIEEVATSSDPSPDAS